MNERIEYTKLFQDPSGFVQLEKGGAVTQNGQLWTALTFLMLAQYAPSESDMVWMKNCWMNAMTLCYRQQGVFARNATSNENNSPDNMMAILAMDKLFYPYSRRTWLQLGLYANVIFKHGQNTKENLATLLAEKTKNKFILWVASFFNVRYNYNNEKDASNSKWFGWLGKNPGMRAAIKIRAGEKSSFFERFCLCVGQIISAYSKEQDAKSTGICCYYATTDSGWLVGVGNAIFRWKLNRDFKGNELGVFLRAMEPQHPMRLFWKNPL